MLRLVRKEADIELVAARIEVETSDGLVELWLGDDALAYVRAALAAQPLPHATRRFGCPRTERNVL